MGSLGQTARLGYRLVNHALKHIARDLYIIVTIIMHWMVNDGKLRFDFEDWAPIPSPTF